MLDHYAEYFRLLLTGQPVDACRSLAQSYLLQLDWLRAHQCYAQAYRMERGLPWPEHPLLQTEAGPAEIYSGRHKLRHDSEQMEHLLQQGSLPPAFAAIVRDYRAVERELEAGGPDYLIFRLAPAQRARLAATYGRNLFFPAPAQMPGPALNPALPVERIQADYSNNAPGMTFFDDFLTPAACQALYRFCLDATIWHDCSKRGGYLAAYMHDGFNCELLYQIAFELRARFPLIFKGRPLTQMWAFKYDSQRQGTEVHADAASINVNFWITPDEANQDPGSGGLVVYDSLAPADWDFARYNVETEKIYAFLARSGSRPFTVPYRRNRVVIFNSSLFHRTDHFSFRAGYPNRRINITMLFGYRQT